MKHRMNHHRRVALVLAGAVLVLFAERLVPLADAQSFRAATNGKRKPISGMISSLIDGLVDTFHGRDLVAAFSGESQSESTTSMPATVTPPIPNGCIEIDLDFSSLIKGEYIDTQFGSFGLTLSASGGIGRPRVFDTAGPVDGECGNSEFGAPNMRCLPYDGPGIGEGGEPDGNGTNCNPLGNVLIVQEPGEDCPHDVSKTFTQQGLFL